MPGYAGGSPNSKRPERRPDPAQERAVRHADGPAQIIAGPGSGKTYVIVHRIRHLITRLGVEPSHILVITFTKAAALEMQERFFELTAPERPPVHFGTFHAVFYHILRQSPQYRGYSIITQTERRKLYRQIIHMHKRFACVQEEDLDEVMSRADLCRGTAPAGQGPALSLQKLTAEDILFLAREYEAYLREFRRMDFDGISRCCLSLLREHPEILDAWRETFRYILIDEFQDISPEQYEIMRLLAAPRDNLFIVGDDDQAIYGFRGASPDSMQEFMWDHPQAARIFLDVNYRCSAAIVEAAGRVIEENRNRIAKKIRAAHGEGAGFRLCIAKSAEEQEQYLMETFREKSGRGELARCALICRTNYDCALWAQRLRVQGLACVLREAPKNPFEHFVIRDLMAYLALADGHMERRYFLRVMNRPVRYLRRECVPAERICMEELLDFYRDAPVLQAAVRRLFDDLDKLRGKKPHLQLHYVRKVIGYDSYLREKYGADRAEELLRTAEDLQEMAKRFGSFQEMNDYISQYGEILKEREPDSKAAGEDSKEGLQLMTMHAAKGLEFDTVYLPDCQEGKIPYARAKTAAQIEEERRMFYVAMTRAKRELCVTACQGRSGKDGPSRFLACLHQASSSSPTSSSNSAASRYSSKASATASYSSSSSI